MTAAKPLRLLNVAELYPPGYAGGAGAYVHDTCEFLAARGHDVRVLCTEARDGAEPYSVREERVGRVDVLRINLPYFRNLDPAGWHMSTMQWRAHCRRIEVIADRLLDAWRPDIVQYHTPNSLIEEMLSSLRRRQLPIVGMTHDAWTVCRRTSLFRSPTDTECSGPALAKCLECVYTHFDGTRARGLLKLPWRVARLGVYPAYRVLQRRHLRGHVDGVIAYSRFEEAAHALFVDAPVEHIHLGIDLSLLPAGFPKRPRTPVRFGFMGGFVDHKGTWDLLAAAAALKAKDLPFELHIWGPGQSAQAIGARGLADVVKLRGMYAPHEKWQAYADIDVLVMATRWAEPFGRVVQEAAAAGVPTIAPRIGGITEQIRDGHDGLLFAVRDVAGLESALTAVLRDPGLHARLAGNLWQVVDTRDAVVQMEALYRRILDERAPSQRAEGGDAQGRP